MRRATFAVKNDFSEASPSGAHNGLLSRVKRSLVPPGMFPGGGLILGVLVALWVTLHKIYLNAYSNSFIELFYKKHQ